MSGMKRILDRSVRPTLLRSQVEYLRARLTTLPEETRVLDEICRRDLIKLFGRIAIQHDLNYGNANYVEDKDTGELTLVRDIPIYKPMNPHSVAEAAFAKYKQGGADIDASFAALTKDEQYAAMDLISGDLPAAKFTEAMKQVFNQYINDKISGKINFGKAAGDVKGTDDL